jgi:acetoin utilization protein AcuB
MQVRNYMTTLVSTLDQDARLLDAALLIRRTGKRHVPVIDGEKRVVGIITDRDVSRLAPSLLRPISPEEYNAVFEATPITRAMTRKPITVDADAPMREAVNLLFNKKIGALPVVESGKLVGIITVSDALGLLYEMLSQEPAPAPAADAAGG